jgi:hypothetical protein
MDNVLSSSATHFIMEYCSYMYGMGVQLCTREGSGQAGAAPAKQLAPLHARAMYGWVAGGEVNE